MKVLVGAVLIVAEKVLVIRFHNTM